MVLKFLKTIVSGSASRLLKQSTFYNNQL